MKTSSHNSQCIVPACKSRKLAKGMCSKHYSRLRRYGDISFTTLQRGEGATSIDRFWSRVNKNGAMQPHMQTQCWEWQRSPSEKQHGAITVDGRRWMVHRFSWYLLTGQEPQFNILHKCDNPPCVNPDHLYEGTQADNVRDMMERNRCQTGERRRDAKLTDDQVRQVYDLCKTMSPKIIAQQFGVSRQLISSIKFGRGRKTALAAMQTSITV